MPDCRNIVTYPCGDNNEFSFTNQCHRFSFFMETYGVDSYEIYFIGGRYFVRTSNNNNYPPEIFIYYQSSYVSQHISTLAKDSLIRSCVNNNNHCHESTFRKTLRMVVLHDGTIFLQSLIASF